MSIKKHLNNVVLLHGAVGAEGQLIPLEKALEARFNVYKMNFRGHGGKVFDGDFSIKNFSDDLLHFLNENNLDKVSVFGYSMGGYVACYFASLYPERVTSIFTLGTKWLWSKETAQKESRFLDPKAIEEKVPAFAEVLRKRHLPNDWKETLKHTEGLLKNLGDNPPLTEEVFHKLSLPVTLSVGEADNVVSVEETQQVSQWLPNASLMVFPDTQHPIEKINLSNLACEIGDFFIKTGNI